MDASLIIVMLISDSLNKLKYTILLEAHINYINLQTLVHLSELYFLCHVNYN